MSLNRYHTLKRGKPLRSKGRRAKRQENDLRAFRAAVHARVWCELGKPACSPAQHRGSHAHHKLRRSQGGSHGPDNGLLVCPEGHSFVHANPAISYERGWLRHREAS